MYALQYTTSTIVSGGGDATIKIWDTRTVKCQRTLLGHDGTVMAVQVRSSSFQIQFKGFYNLAKDEQDQN